jgi:hypothetical protein
MVPHLRFSQIAAVFQVKAWTMGDPRGEYLFDFSVELFHSAQLVNSEEP